MKFLSFSKIYWLTGIVLVFSSCFKDLDTVPLDDDELTSAAVYENPENYKKVLAKIYAGLSVTGQQGPAGQADIAGIDEGFGQYMRMYWYLQELSTDEAVIGWNDNTIKDFHEQDWSPDDGFIYACYSRIFYQISLCNEFLRETTDAKLNSRSVDAGLRAEIQTFRAEVRFLRAFSYWHALDLFRNVPFVTEEDAVGAFFPRQIQKDELFTYIESELKAIDGDLAAPKANEYGRVDKAAAWTLLAKLYLNAQVYIGTDHNTDCITNCKKVIESGYSLDTDFTHLFLADNNNSPEIIFAAAYDGTRTRTYGGMTFVIHAAVGGSMNPAAFGLDGGWGGTRTTSAIVNKFPADAIGGGGEGEVLVSPNPGATGYPQLEIPGSYQEWMPGNAATVKTAFSVASDNQFETYAYFEAGTKFKFTQGGTWDVNYGDAENDGILEAGGGDLTIAETGYYKINVNLDDLTYSIAKITWGLIGSATAGGWDSDQDMVYNPADDSWEITAPLVAGQVKFRANDAWDINFGDDGGNALLEGGGANIEIPSGGTYKIKLYLGAPDYTYSIEKLSFSYDHRAQFHTDGQSLEINDISLFTEGYAVSKFRNVTSAGTPGSDVTFVDTDMPIFRLGDVYLMYAEAVKRNGSGGSLGEATNYINALRERAYGDASGNISESDLTLEFILDERARELMWEGHRRTDLVRFDQFTDGSYVWPWKGSTPEGTSTSGYLDVYPIPSNDRSANPNLKQNDGY